MAAAASVTGLVPPVDVKRIPTITLSNQTFQFRKGKWQQDASGSKSKMKLTDEIDSLKEQINFLKIKLDIALDMLATRTIEVEELQQLLQSRKSGKSDSKKKKTNNSDLAEQDSPKRSSPSKPPLPPSQRRSKTPKMQSRKRQSSSPSHHRSSSQSP